MFCLPPHFTPLVSHVDPVMVRPGHWGLRQRLRLPDDTEAVLYNVILSAARCDSREKLWTTDTVLGSLVTTGSPGSREPGPGWCWRPGETSPGQGSSLQWADLAVERPARPAQDNWQDPGCRWGSTLYMTLVFHSFLLLGSQTTAPAALTNKCRERLMQLQSSTLASSTR